MLKHLGNTVVLNEWRKPESGPALVFPAPCTCAVEAQTPSPASRHPRHAFASWLHALHSKGWRPSPQRPARRPLLRQLAAGRHALSVPAQIPHWIALGSAGADELSPPPNPDHTGRPAAVFSWAPWLANRPHESDCNGRLPAVCRFSTINSAHTDDKDGTCAHGMGRQAHHAVFEEANTTSCSRSNKAQTANCDARDTAAPYSQRPCVPRQQNKKYAAGLMVWSTPHTRIP